MRSKYERKMHVRTTHEEIFIDNGDNDDAFSECDARRLS